MRCPRCQVRCLGIINRREKAVQVRERDGLPSTTPSSETREEERRDPDTYRRFRELAGASQSSVSMIRPWTNASTSPFGRHNQRIGKCSTGASPPEARRLNSSWPSRPFAGLRPAGGSR